MADTGPAQGIDQAAAGRQHDAEVAQIMATLGEQNPHTAEMNLPPALMEDGAA
jgi:hypothetical protein